MLPSPFTALAPPRLKPSLPTLCPPPPWPHAAFTLTDFLSGSEHERLQTDFANNLRRLEDEAEMARATASRLNARVNELVAAEQVG